MQIRINGIKLIAASEVLLIFYLCLPITISLLNSLLIRLLMLFAAVLFIAGLAMMNKWKTLIEFFVLFSLTLLFWNVVWRRQYDSIAYIYYCFASLSFAFGSVVIYNSEDTELVRRLFILMTAIFTITAVTTILGLNIYPLAARELARGSTYDTSLDFDVYKAKYRRMNIAGWSQIYGMLFAVPCNCLMWKKTRKIVYLIFMIVIEVAIFASQITFAVLLSLAFIFAIFAIGENSSKQVVVILVLLVLLSVVYLNLNTILIAVINMSGDIGADFLKIKLEDLRQLLVFRNSVGDASARSELYRDSFGAFLNSPIFGAIFNRDVADNVIGRHSELLDILGGIGLLGLGGIVFSITKYVHFLKKVEIGVKKKLAVIFMGFIVLAILNPVLNSPQIFAVAFLYPVLCAKMIGYKKAERASTIMKVRVGRIGNGNS